jgi:hypothetical protein
MDNHSTGKLTLTNSETKKVYEYDVENINGVMFLRNDEKEFRYEFSSETSRHKLSETISDLEDELKRLKERKTFLWDSD